MSELEIFLNEIGIIEKPKKPAHAPIQQPKVKTPMVSQGWRPEYSGQEPPF